jgi:hypothetical protein
MDKDNKITYTLKICYNPETDEIEYIAEGLDDNFNFTPISPFDLNTDITSFVTSEDMLAMKKLYDIEDD